MIWFTFKPYPLPLRTYSINSTIYITEPQRNEEYVTSFYKRVREKHRANFGRQLGKSLVVKFI